MVDFIRYGDGFYAEVYDNIPHPTKPATTIMKVKPTELLEQAKNLDKNDPLRDRLNGTYTKEYPTDLIIPQHRGIYGGSYLAFCDWNGNKCEQFIEDIAYKILHLPALEWQRKMNEQLKLIGIQMIKNSAELIMQPEPYRKQMEKSFISLHTGDDKEKEPENQQVPGGY